MIEIPKRSSLANQVTDILRHNLDEPEWADGLPSERALCDGLQVSRPTLRAALDMFRYEGALRFSQNRRKRIPVTNRKVRGLTGRKVIGFLTSEPMHGLYHSTIFTIDELRRHLHNAGFGLEVRADPRLKRQNPTGILEEFADQIKTDCWVLHRASAGVQKWFAERRIRAIVLGTCHRGIQFPSIDFDYGAVGRHAAGVLLSKGHRQIALLAHQTGLAGDLARASGFLEVAQTIRRDGATPLVWYHDGTPADTRSALHRLFRTRNAPTGMAVSHAIHVLSVMTQLMNDGIRIPRDVSLISCDDQMFMAYLTPSVARYRFDWNAYAARLARMVARLANTGTLANRAIQIMPQFQNGDSLAARN
ncbi:MAG: substrate-binding domain-containing protein [Verrucomicrobia bacterium]|nr:substrate-binding domain-containing protein [Verrucomicrobiota bacterium]